MPIAEINADLCQGCGKCVDTCPVDVIRLDVDPDAGDLRSPCATGCPAGVSVRKYSYYVEMDMMDKAARALAEHLPFPAITGRICPHPCEAKCARAEVDEPVNINALERYVGDYLLKRGFDASIPIYAGKVAVAGSGPAGLSCAYFLARKGYEVTVFEALDVAGGVPRVGVPAYRLPHEIVDAEVRSLQDMGVTIRTGIAVGVDISLDELMDEYAAVFFAGGLQASKRQAVEGDGLEGVYYALELLYQVGLGSGAHVGKKVAIIGGGSVAFDVAQTLNRMGAEKIHIFYRNGIERMRALPEEIEQAIEEGIHIHAYHTVKRITGEGGRVRGIDVESTQAGNESDAEEESYEVDQVVFAIGQTLDERLVPSALATGPDGMVLVDQVTLETSVHGVFAGGDIVNGGGLAVEAIAAGREGAESIDRFLRGLDMREGRNKYRRVQQIPKKGIAILPRQEEECLSACERSASDAEVRQTLSENQARIEAQRCMTCGSRAVIAHPQDCMVCLYCERDCAAHAITITPERIARRMGPWDLDG